MFIFLSKAILTSIMILLTGIGGGYVIDSLITKEPVLNNQPMQSTLDGNQYTPSPTQLPSAVLGSTQRIIVTPTLTSIQNDADPIVKCTSKTGVKMVKKSVCSSYTDCSDGYGGYIFESVDACKKRWEQIGANLKKSAQDYANALLEQQRLQSSSYNIDNSGYQKEINDKIQEMGEISDQFSQEIYNNQQQLQQDLQNLIKITTPEPTPQPQGQGQMDYYMYQ